MAMGGRLGLQLRVSRHSGETYEKGKGKGIRSVAALGNIKTSEPKKEIQFHIGGFSRRL